MNAVFVRLVVALMLSCMTSAAFGQPPTGTTAPVATGGPWFTWKPLPPLPDEEGFAGMFAGESGEALIAVGGANFPNGYPWEGGAKVWHDGVFVLPQPDGAWKKLPSPFPYRIAYGVSAPWKGGVVFAGGESPPSETNARAPVVRKEVHRATWNGDTLSLEKLPPFPKPAAHACGTTIGDVLYLAGGVESAEATAALKTFWALDLAAPAAERAWKELPPWPGPGRMQAVCGVLGGEFYLFGGIELAAGPEGKPQRVEPYLRDAYRYTPAAPLPGGGVSLAEGRWTRLADLPASRAAAVGPALATGASHLAILGGTEERHQHLDRPTHPGFGRDVFLYHRITNTWAILPEAVPAGLSRVTTPLAKWRGEAVVVSGEKSPGKRSPEVVRVAALPQRAAFGWINYLALGAYLAGMVWLGIGFTKGNETTDDFFRGGQGIPWWAAGISIFATMLSSITYMAVPGNAFAAGWGNYLTNAYLLITPIVVWIYLPFYRRLNVTSAYEYLELRFNVACRWLGSLLFILFQGGRISVVILIPSLALSTVTDLNLSACVVLMGLVSIVYTAMGGIEAVVWTDVVQAGVLVAGAVFSLALILFQVDGGLIGVFNTAQADGKLFQQVSWNLDLTIASAWVVVVGSMLGNLLPYTASQDVVQRYTTTPDEPAAARAVWTNALIALPANTLFFVIGTALYAFYKAHPERLDPTMTDDAVFPLFIVRELPAGIAGLVIAGVFAAAQSTISSSLNSVATCYVTDFHRKWFPLQNDAALLRTARYATVLVGAGGTLAALVLATSNVRSLWEAFLEILSLFGGTLSGLFALGIFTRRANGTGALVGAAASAAVVIAVKLFTPLHFFTYAPIGIAVVLVVGWLASILVPAPPKPLEGLTIHSLFRKAAA